MAELDKCTNQGNENVVLVEGTVGETFDSSSERDKWESFGVVETKPLSGMRYADGTPAQRTPSSYQDMIAVGGGARIYPSWNMLTRWWPRILHGGTLTENTDYTPGSALDEWDALIFNSVEWRKYTSCVVSNATISGAEGGPIMLDLTLIGKTASDESAVSPLPDFVETVLDNRILFSGGSLTMGDVGTEDTYSFDSFSISIDHFVTPKYWNSTTAQCLESQGRIVSATFGFPWNSDINSRLHQQGNTGLNAVLRLESGDSNGHYYDTIDLNEIRWGDGDPPLVFDGDMGYQLSGICHVSGTEASPVQDITIQHHNDTP